MLVQIMKAKKKKRWQKSNKHKGLNDSTNLHIVIFWVVIAS